MNSVASSQNTPPVPHLSMLETVSVLLMLQTNGMGPIWAVDTRVYLSYCGPISDKLNVNCGIYQESILEPFCALC